MEVLATLIVILLGIAGTVFVQRYRWTLMERRLINFSFVAHILSAFVQLWINLSLYPGSDSIGCFRRASRYADLVTSAPFIWGPRVVAHTLQLDIGWPLSGFAYTASGSVTGLAVLPVLLTGGSLIATSLFFATASFFGKVLCLRAFRNSVRPEYRTRLALVFLLIPSVVFWTSGLVKESIAVTGLGLAVFGWSRIVRHTRTVSGTLWTLHGAVLVGLVKPYLLFPFAIASGVWYYWHHADIGRNRIRPIHLVVGAMIAVGGVIALGELFPQYSASRVGEEAARLQELGAIVRGGTSYDIVEEPNRTLAGQIAYAPAALATSLFRPLPFEVVNIVSAINALEVFILTILLLLGLRNQGLRGFIRLIFRNPLLMFAFSFTIVAGVAIGLATTNLGTLSRYRVPMFPFYVTLIAAAYPLRRRPRRRPQAPLRALSASSTNRSR